MAPDLDGDLGVDVLVVGAGIQGLYVARELARTYRVCVVGDPAVATGTLESAGYLSAGYDGTDPNRAQPARRAAAWWRLWAESNAVPFDPEPAWYLVPPSELVTRTRYWSDATLSATQCEALPLDFVGGSLSDAIPFRVDTDVVINPATLLTRLRTGIEDVILSGEVVRFGLVSDDVIDHVQVQLGEQVVPIVPRFVVLAAGVGNADLLTKLSSRFSDQAKRKATRELADTSQAVRCQYQLCLRGADLPDVNGHFGGLTIASHRRGDGDQRIWVVTPPADDARTVLGPANLRFELSVDPAAVADLVGRLRAMSPTIDQMAGDVEWSVYASRRTQHPSLAVPDTSTVAQPVPAKLEKFGLESFLAAWPSHLAYAQFVGDAVAERINDALGAPGDFSEGPQPSDLSDRPDSLRARWDGDDFPWQDWSTFSAAHGIGVA
jgi:glycine/D-amino acid oxidase-like deaminating enzyme